MNYFKELFRKLLYLKSFIHFQRYGKNIILSNGGVIIRPKEISFGENVFISNNFHISARNLVFGNNIMIGPNLVIECDNHVYNIPGKTMYEVRHERNIGQVTIENDVWIGANVTILPNAKISEGTIVGAGSIVTKPLPPYTICVGAPCMPIKTRFTIQQLIYHLNQTNSVYDFEQIINLWKKNNLIF